MRIIAVALASTLESAIAVSLIADVLPNANVEAPFHMLSLVLANLWKESSIASNHSAPVTNVPAAL